MKAKTVRLLAGGLAATIIMTNMATMPVFANDISVPVDSAIEVVAEEAPATEESQETEVVTETAEEAAATEEAVTEEAAATEEAAQVTEEAAATEEAATEEAATEEAAATEETAQTTEEAAATEEAATEEAAAQEAEEIQPSEEIIALAAVDTQTAEEVTSPEATETSTEKTAVEGEKTQEKQAEEITKAESEEEKKLIEEEAEKLANSVNSIGDLMDLLIKKDTTKVLPEAKITEREASTVPNTKPGFATAVVSSACGKAIEKLLKVVPGGEYITNPVRDLVLKMFGLKTDDQALEKLIYKRFDETNEKIDTLRGETKREIETIGSIRTYGERLDAFTNSSDALASKIQKIKKSDMSENEKAIMIASLIGGSDKWTVGGENIFTKMDSAAQTLRTTSNNGPSADPSSRNLFELFYDYNKETSMFSGEAMSKADKAIKKRTSDYATNCGILFMALKAHERVAELTPDEVSELKGETLKTYNSIKSDKQTIQLYMKDVIETFTGDKKAELKSRQTGILDAAKEYYSKDQRIFLNKSGENLTEIQLAPTMYTVKSEKFDGTDLKDKAAINGDQVKKLQDHVNSLGMTMSKYLETLGFDMESIEKTGRHARLSTLTDNSETGISSRDTSVSKTYKAINMTEKGAKETETVYYTSYRSRFSASSKTEKDALLAVFMTPETAKKVAELKKAGDPLEEYWIPVEYEIPKIEMRGSTHVEKSFGEKVGDFFRSLLPF